VISTAASGMQLQKQYNTLSDKEFYQMCDTINNTAQFLSNTIDDFTSYIKGDTKIVEFNLKNDSNTFLQLIDATIQADRLNIILELEENINIKGYPNQLIQCFINIFNNAKDALVQNNDESNRYIFIKQKIIDDKVFISFKDNAGGIPEDIILRIFEPYFTTKHKSQGTGLGLHMTYNLISSMGGTLNVKNTEYLFNKQELKGAEFEIIIPIC
jgi:signal transduction histidine kinase